MTSSTPEPGSPARRPLLTRRNLLAATGLTAAGVSAGPLLGWSTAQAAVSPDCPPGTTAPVPPAARGPAIPASGYLVEEIADRVYWLTDGLYQMIFVTTAEGVVAVDAPPTIGKNILRAIATVTHSRATHAIYTHPHADHNRPTVPYPGGPLSRLGTRDEVLIQQEYVAELRAQAASAIATFNPASVYQSVDPTNPWAIFRAYLDGVAGQAASAVIPNWVDRLGGADVYTLPNAYQLVESLRIDYGQLRPFRHHPRQPRLQPTLHGWVPPARIPTSRGHGNLLR